MDKGEEDDDEEAWLQLRPVEPLPSQCCGSGCSPCVFDLYQRDLASWEAARASKDRSLLSGEETQVRGSSVTWPQPCAVYLLAEASFDSVQQREKSELNGSRLTQVQSLALSW